MPKRVLHIVSVMNYGGAETLLMNIFRTIDRSQVTFDFLAVREDDGAYESEIKSLGGKIYKIPAIKKCGYFKFKKNLRAFFLSHPEYTTVHCHLNTLSGLVLPVAKEAGVEVRIAHSHGIKFPHRFPFSVAVRIWKRKIPDCATQFFACSDDAAKALYGKHASESVTVKNGIDVKNFKYTKERAFECKKQLELCGKFVVGHVGRFSEPKNHTFLIDIFAEVCKKRDDAVLLLVGKGKLEGEVREKARQKGVLDRIVFAGVRSDVENCLMAMDVFVFPSLFEGLGIAAIEAQASGLPCIFSDGVPEAAVVCECAIKLPLGDGAEKWAVAVLDVSRDERRDRTEEIANAGYDILSTSEKLKEFYINGTFDF